MRRLILYFICCNSFPFFLPAAVAQCSYPVTLRTNKDYCVGSPLIATSTHAMQQITWYRNGQAVNTVTGAQSLSTQFTPVTIFPNTDSLDLFFAYTRLGSDDAGNVYALYDDHLLLKATPAGALSQIVIFTAAFPNPGEVTGMSVDGAGNVYITSYTSVNLARVTTLAWKVPAGTVSATVRSLPTAVPIAAVPADSLPVSADFIDCRNNIYLYCYSGAIYRYAPAGGSATFMGAADGGCEFTTGIGEIQVDPAGNIFFMDGNSIKKIPPGTTTPVIAVPGSCTTNDNRTILNFWMDANDTIYLSGYEASKKIDLVEKWAPGASAGQQILSYSLTQGARGYCPITMDARGNIFVGYTGGPNIYEYKRTTSIDSAFTPTDTGAYYAVVTDIRGYTTTSDTIHIATPAPSIRITATATSAPVCTPITFTAQTSNAGPNPAFQWQVSGVPAGGDSASYSYNLFADGSQVYCIMTTQAGCAGPQQDTSNVIQLSIDPHGAASVTIATPKDSICQGDTAAFEATVTNGSAKPTYEWLLNGTATGDDSAGYVNNNFKNGDVVTCLITSDDVCGLAKSNSISMVVNTRPAVESGKVFTIPYGQSLTLTPVVTGYVSSYLWTPAAGLSDPTISNPVADPDANTLYTLTVTAPGGCSDSGTILVNVYTPLSIPGAFTPNGDGHNDLFYVLGGPVDSRVEEFAVFNRYGAEVFHVHGVVPGDPNFGWNGNFSGSPAPAGAYVYMVEMQFANGSRQVYKGTMILIR